MKKLLLGFLISIFLLNIHVFNVQAMPAYQKMVEFIQPDGSKINIYLKGDENVKWAETEDGFSLMFNKNGYYEYAKLDSRGDMVPSGVRARDISKRTKKEKQFLTKIQKKLKYNRDQIHMMKQITNIYNTQKRAFPTTGSRKLVCILMGFTDKAFTKTQADFDNLFNQVGYTTGGATGSIKDFFAEASYNQFDLTVTVAGPYTAANNMAYYGANDVSGNDLRPRELVTEAVNAANAAVNYADFDNDGDGSVDGVYVIYAGYGEEAGASANAIWAHAWSIPSVVLDGKTITTYSCSSEMRGTSGTNMTRIGVICHEFGHVLGAPDFYDTDYATGGQYDGTGAWDLQAGGSWNGAASDGATPAHPNAYTKCYIYGWATPTILSSAQALTLYNSAQNSCSFYRYNTATANEYFLMENRQQVGFDAYTPGHGLLVYHVDGTWVAAHDGSNDINNTSHQGMFPMSAVAITANGVSLSSANKIDVSGCPFPGTSSKTSFTDATTPNSKSWASVNTAKDLLNITETSGIINLNFMGPVGGSATVTVTQPNTTDVSKNSTNQEIIQIVVRASANGQTATSFTFNTTGTTDVATDITNAKLWYTGTSTTFAATTQIGSTITSPSCSFTISGSQAVARNVNEVFWLTYDIPSGATTANVVDAECISVTITSGIVNPSTTAPVGSRTIAAPVAPPLLGKVLFDATSGQSLASADWIVDADATNAGWYSSGVCHTTGTEYLAQRYPTPAAPTSEADWDGGNSRWAYELYLLGYTIESLGPCQDITYGNGANPQDLSNYDVFICNEPNVQFTAAEKTAIVNFVNAGGGLYMGADHGDPNPVTCAGTEADRNCDGWNSTEVWNDLMSGNPFGIQFNQDNTASPTSTNVNADPSDPILHGTAGNVSSISFNQGATMTINTASNPTAKAAVFMLGEPLTSTTNIMVAYSEYGAGRVVGVGDSSPTGDATGDTNGETRNNNWIDANNGTMILNATIWLMGTASPTLAVTPSSLTNLNYVLAAGPSAAQTFSLSGTYLDGTSVTVTAPTNFEVSLSAGSGYGASVNVAYTAPTLNATTIYVRLASGLSVSTYSGNVTCSDNGTATNVTVAVDGAVTASGGGGTCASETFAVGATSSTYATVTWTGDDGGTWTSTLCRKDQTITTGNTVCFKGYTESSSISGGIGDLTVTTKFPFSDGTYNMPVTVNGTSVGTVPVSTTLTTTTISGINVTGNIVVRFTSDGTKRASIDDLSWTCYSGVSTPTLAVTSATLTGFSYVQGAGPSTEQTFVLSGTNLDATDVTLTAPTNYEISETSGAGYTSPITLSAYNGTNKTIYVRLKAGLSIGAYNSEVISISGGGDVDGESVTCSGNVTGVPTISTSGSLVAVNTIYGTPSASPTNFTVSGTNMSAGITITPPAGYEVSTTIGSGYASSIVVGVAGTISPTTVYVRLAGTTNVGSYAGNIVCSSTGATSQNVATVSSTVSAKALTITADNENKIFGNVLTSGSGMTAFTSVGLENSETIGSVTLTYGTGALAGDAVGTYSGQVVPNLATGGTFTTSNYTITYVSGDIIVTAAPAVNVFISEYAGAGYNNTFSLEYIELTNTGTSSQDLTGWQLLYYNATSLEETINLTGTIGANSAYLIAMRSGTTIINGVTADKIASVSSMNSTGYVILKDATTAVVDQAGASADKFADGKNYEFTNCTGDNLPTANWVDLGTGNGTPGVVNCAGPTLAVSVATLTSFQYVVGGGPSAEQSFNLSGSVLNGTDVVLTAPTNYEISKTSGAGFTSTTLTFVAFDGTSTTVYVRLKAGLPVNSYNLEDIAISGGGDPDGETVTCSGDVILPALSVTSDILMGYTYILGAGPSAEQSSVLSGTNMNGTDVTITPPTNYEISLTSGAGFVSTPITLSAYDGTNTTIYIRLIAGLPQSNYNGEDITISGGGSLDATITNSGSVTGIPTISTSGSLVAVNTIYGTPSATPTSFSVSGADMLAGITITPPAGYEVSTTIGSGYASSIVVGAAGNITSTTVYVRLAGTTNVGSYAGNIVCTSTSATTVNVATVSSAVSAKALTITADNESKIFGNVLTSGAGKTTFTSLGLENSETIGSVTLTYGTGALAGDAVGTYGNQIVPSLATGGTFTASNYTITYVAGDIQVISVPSVCANETFAVGATSTTYATVTWTGNDGGTWTSTSCRKDQTITSGNTVCFKGYTESPTFSNGIVDLTVTTKFPFSDGTYNMPVKVNGVQVGTVPVSTTLTTTTLTGINVAGNVVVRFESDGAKRVAMDDLSWTCMASCTQPTTQATNFGTNTITTNSMNVTWTRGDGTGGVIVVAREGSPVNSDPASTTVYTADNNFSGTPDEIGVGNFVVYKGTGTSASITGLLDNTTYYFAIYEYNTVDNCYMLGALTGNATTVDACVTTPTVTTTVAINSITGTSAASGGQTLNAGASCSITAKGVCWGTATLPTIADNISTDGTGTTDFVSALTPLSVNTLYYVRAYVTNSNGTGYGNQLSFYTLANVPSAPTVNGATSNTVTVDVNINSNPVNTTFAIHETSTGLFVQADGSLGASAVWLTDVAWGATVVTGLNSSTTYTFEVKAKNGDGVETAYSTTTNCATLCVASSIPFSEGFNDVAMPACWSEAIVADPGTNPTLTYVTSGTSPTITPNEGTHCVKFNSYSCSSGAEIRLITPSLITTGKSTMYVQFDWYYDSGYSSYLNEGMTVQYSTNGGTTWSTVQYYKRYSATPGWVTEVCNMPVGFDNQASVLVGFLFHSQYGNNCYFDHVVIDESVIYPEPTNHPTAFTCGSPGGKTLPLTWTDAIGAQLPHKYLIKWSDVSYAAITNPVDGSFVNDGANAHNIAYGVEAYTPNNLMPNTTYYFKIFPYTNSGADVNYKVDGTIQTTSCTTLNLTALFPADLAIIAVNTQITGHPSGASADEICFIAFQDITEQTDIDFTDDGYNKSTDTYWGTTEGRISLVRNVGAPTITKGTPICFQGMGTSGAGFNIYVCGVNDDANWTITSNGGPYDLNVDDQIWIMEGGDWVSNQYTGNLLYGWTATGWKPDLGSVLGWSTKGSMLFPGAECFNTDVTLNASHDKVKYIGPLTIETQSNWIARINDNANWNGYASNGDYDAAVNPNTSSLADYSGSCISFPVSTTINHNGGSAGVWTGEANEDWFTCENWEDLIIPRQTTDVTIKVSPPNHITIDNGIPSMPEASCHSITIDKEVEGPVAVFTPLKLKLNNDHSVLNVYGDFTNNGDLVHTKGVVKFVDAESQIIDGTSPNNFYNLEIDKSSGAVSLNVDISVADTLTLTSGIISTGVNKVSVTNTSSAGIFGGDNSSFVNGNLQRNITTNTETYAFPIGYGNTPADFHRVDIINNNMTGVSYIGASVANTVESGFNIDDSLSVITEGIDVMGEILESSIWTLTPDIQPTGGTTYGVKLYVENVTGLSAADDNGFYAVKRPSASTTYADWTNLNADLSATTIPAATLAGRVYNLGAGYAERTGYKEFSKHGIAKKGVFTPVDLLIFDAVRDGKYVNVNWTTANEKNNDYFTVERSIDASEFEFVTNYPGAGNSMIPLNYNIVDYTPYTEKSYYRLTQTDYDGTSTYSKIVAVDGDKLNSENISIVKVENAIQIAINNSKTSTYYVEIVDVLGRILYKEKFNSKSNKIMIDIDNRSFSKGIYNVAIFNENEIHSKKILID